MNIFSKLIRWLVLFLILGGIFSPGSAAAQGTDPTDNEVNVIAKQLYCPVCENIPLDACGTAACEQWRGIIRDKLGEGWSEDQIKDYFVVQYGDRVLAEPPRQGFNWVVYIVPLLIFAVGILLLYQAFIHWRRAEPDRSTREDTNRAAKSQKTPDEYISRVEEELRKRK
jgi:cytochrome c-type biogenesis protein CcmH